MPCPSDLKSDRTSLKSNTENQRPIGIFDSGLGGLSIARSIRDILPAEDIVYFADLKHSPYGCKSKEQVINRSECIADFLIKQNCKLVVVACNTATVNSIGILRSRCSIPFVGVEPGIKPAAFQSVNGVIGVLATEQTLRSTSYQKLKASYSDKVIIEERACPDFVSIVEGLDHENEVAIVKAEQYIRPLLEAGCDQIILGCTHFSFLKPAINEVVGKNAVVIDTAIAVGNEVQRRLNRLGIRKDFECSGSVEFRTNGDLENSSASICKLWGQEVSSVYQNSI